MAPTLIVETSGRVAHLAQLLRDEARLYGELIALVHREREAVLDSTPDALTAVTAEKETILARIARIESQRLLWLASWARENGLDTGSVTMASIIGALPANQAAELAPARDALMAHLRDLAELNARNGELVSSALRIVNRRLDAYQRVAAGGYHCTGERARTGRAAVATLDFRA